MCGGHGAAEPGVPGPRGGHPAPGTRHQARATILDDGGDEGQQVRRNIHICCGIPGWGKSVFRNRVLYFLS